MNAKFRCESWNKITWPHHCLSHCCLVILKFSLRYEEVVNVKVQWVLDSNRVLMSVHDSLVDYCHFLKVSVRLGCSCMDFSSEVQGTSDHMILDLLSCFLL